MRKHTTEEFKEFVNKTEGGKYKVLGDYINARTKIKMKHMECNNEYFVVPYSFKAGNRCPECFGSKKKTTKQFKKEVFDQVGDEYKVLEKYTNARTEIKMKHIACNNNFYMTPDDFINGGNRCPSCFGNFKKTTEEFKREVYEMYGDEFVVLGKYINAHTKLLVLHNCSDIMNHCYNVKPNNLLSGKGCPRCASNLRREEYAKTTKQFKNEVYGQVGEEYKVLGKYFNAKTKIKFKHMECNYEFNMTPDSFINKKSRCPKCYRNFKKTTEEFKKELFKVHGDRYILLEEYINGKTKLKFKDEICGDEWSTYPDSILQGHGCPKCAGNKPRNTEEFKKEVYDLVGNEYLVLGEYINSDEKITFKHNIGSCKYTWETRPSVFKRGHRCPKCSNSKMESYFLDFLDELSFVKGEDFYHNIAVPGCENIQSLKFDFKIIGNKEILIEFDGEFHYQNIIDINILKKQMKRDAIKDEFCEKEKIDLIRIPYWEFDDFKCLLSTYDINELKTIINKGEFKLFLEEELNIFDNYSLVKTN